MYSNTPLYNHCLNIQRQAQSKSCAFAFFGARLDFAVVALSTAALAFRQINKSIQLHFQYSPKMECVSSKNSGPLNIPSSLCLYLIHHFLDIQGKAQGKGCTLPFLGARLD